MSKHLVKITDLIKDYAKIVDELREENRILKEKIIELNALERKEEAERFHTNLSKQMSNVNQVKQELEHIRSPYTLHQILDLYCKGDYNAELLLQHSLKILT